MKKGSGKQILLSVLYDLSTRRIPEDQLGAATKRLRTGLLLHGSTAEESYEAVARLRWGSEEDEDGIRRQGVSTTGGVFVSDVLETLFELPGMKAHVLANHPGLSPEDVEACAHALWLLVSATQMFAELNEVEATGDLDIDGWVSGMMAKYDHYFRERGREPPA